MSTEIIHKLREFWRSKGARLVESFDARSGAATFHPYTFFGALETTPLYLSYLQNCCRPTDMVSNADESHHLAYFQQYQVIIRPYPSDILNLYWESLEHLGLYSQEFDIEIAEDNWKAPTLSSYGKGWEVQVNGFEITQITRFEIVGGVKCDPIGEIAYGIQRLAKIKSLQKYLEFDAAADSVTRKINNMVEQSMKDEILHIDPAKALSDIEKNIVICSEKISNKRFFHAYETLLELNHQFNLLDSAATVPYDSKVRITKIFGSLAHSIAKSYLECSKVYT